MFPYRSRPAAHAAIWFKRMKISDRIRLTIEQKIQEGSLLPGDPIDENRLMAEYGASRTPLREALLQLQAQGLLESLPRGGMVVAKMDVQQLLAMWELLAELESLCARYACERMSEEEKRLLAQLHHEARAIVDANDAEGWQQANLDFHEVLYKGSRNPYLRQEILRMRARTGAYRRHAFGPVGRLQASYQQHASILESILANDAQGVVSAMFLHMSPGHGTRGVTDLIANLPKVLLS